MRNRPPTPIRFTPVGASDTLDQTQVFKGAMSSLQNLIPDPTTENLWVPRPAALAVADFVAAGFTSPGIITCTYVVGTRIYGMVASTAVGGKDRPFCFDTAGNSFVTITGATNNNTPTSPAATGAWTPPHIDLIGVYLIVAHPGFPSTDGKFFGVINISNPAAVTYDSGQTATNALPCAPSWVSQFSGRAYYFCNPTTGQPAALASDALDPLTRTNAGYVLTFDDNIPITAAAGLPLENQLGGIIQSLLVFKSTTNIYQVTGDFASTTSPISRNTLNVSTGTLAPNSIVVTTKGIAFMAPDGYRFIDFTAQVSDPIGFAGKGITLPFSASVVPSRVAAACNSSVVRVSTQNGAAPNSPNQEWAYDIVRGIWSGPHTLPASLICNVDNTFFTMPIGYPALIYKSEFTPNSTSTYTENGTPLSWVFQTSLMPDTGEMAQNAMSETTANIGYPAGATIINVTALNQDQQVLAFASLNPSLPSSSWGGFSWGGAVWGGAVKAMAPRVIPWPIPVEFARVSVMIQGTSANGIRLGDLALKYQVLNYLPTV